MSPQRPPQRPQTLMVGGFPREPHGRMRVVGLAAGGWL